MVSNQLKRGIYVSEIVFGKVVVVKYPSVAKTKIVDTTFLDCRTYQRSNALTLELEAAALEKVLRNVASNLRLPSVRYLKNILNQKPQNFSDQLIKEAKIKLEYLPLH